MKKLISLCLLFSILSASTLYSQETPEKSAAGEDKAVVETPEVVETPKVPEVPVEAKAPRTDSSAVILPVNLYDTFAFSPGATPWVRPTMYLLGPVFVTVWGFAEWGYGSSDKIRWKQSRFTGANALNGASDKFGHAWSAYFIKREATFLYRATGSSRLRANIEGALYSEAIMTLLELGDGFSTAQGFDFTDFIFNNIGIVSGLVLDQFPVLDRMFALQWEYIPTKRYRRNIENGKYASADFFTDYSGQKFIFATKLAGIPYLSQTCLRYVNIDLGYFSKGYYNDYYKHNTRNFYLGFSANFSIVFGELLPKGYTSSTLQTAFNYIYVPLDIEAKTWELSKTRNY